MKDAGIKVGKEGCALSMEQNTNDVASMDALIKLRMEDYALSTGRRLITNYAASKDVQVKLSEMECA